MTETTEVRASTNPLGALRALKIPIEVLQVMPNIPTVGGAHNCGFRAQATQNLLSLT